MAILKYTLLRLATFFILFAAGLLLELGMILALIVGLLGSWAVAYLFFNSLRREAGETLARRFSGTRKHGSAELEDNAAEDALAEDYHRGRDGSEDRTEGTPESGPDSGADEDDRSR